MKNQVKGRKNRYRILFLFFAITVFVSSSLSTNGVSGADTGIRVILDNRELSFFDVPPQIINDRTMVPFRAIGEEMGAEVSWEPVAREVTMTMFGKYVLLYIGNPLMTYGTCTFSNGKMVPTTKESYLLESPAIIKDDRTLVPARAIAEGLGGTADWLASDRIVIMTSPQNPAFATPAPVSTTFDNTNWFTNISAALAQQMYEEKQQFILTLYSSTDKNSQMYLPLIKDSAREAGVLVYGVDAAKEPSIEQTLTFVWKYINKSTFEYPVAFTIYGINDVLYAMKPNNAGNVTSFFNSFTRRSTSSLYSGSPGVAPTPTPTPRPSSSPVPNLNQRFTIVDRTTSETMLNDGKKFIYVVYHSNDKDSVTYLDDIKQAAITANVTIYGTDQAGYTENGKWWANPTGTYTYYPTIYFVNGKTIISTEVQPKDINRVVSLFRNF